ncbi:MAG: aldolase [Firmicutes bacterium]|nr:aldolase [Bacillota bacterium]
MQNNKLLHKLRKREVVIGPFCKLAEPAIYELAGLAGFDFAIIDLEHGPLSFESAQNAIRACELARISPVIRVPKNEEHYILRALDIGAHGVQVPAINTKEQAEKLAQACRYYPQGNRGVCRFVRAAEYSRLPKTDYFQYANANVTVIAHLEGVEGINNLDAILAVEGIDVLFIGPYDLSQSLGIPGKVDHPELIAKMRSIVEKAGEKGKLIGTFVETPAAAKDWIKRGVKYISYSVDVGLILEKFTSTVQSVL